MGGMDTKGRYAVHWGASETYGERREESALRRAGRTVPDVAYEHWSPIDLGQVDAILHEADHDPKRMLEILGATQEAYGYLPVAALKRISFGTGAWYAMVYGTATYYDHLRFQPPSQATAATSSPTRGPAAATGRERIEADYLSGLDGAIGRAPKPRPKRAN